MTRVLVVDDDPDIRRVLVYALSDEGYEVDQAPDGHLALELVAQNPPDIILLDMKMPGVDGWAFARLYRERFEHHAPIIVLTAAQDAEQRAADIKAESYLSKPFDLDGLIMRVANVAKRIGAVQGPSG